MPQLVVQIVRKHPGKSTFEVLPQMGGRADACLDRQASPLCSRLRAPARPSCCDGHLGHDRGDDPTPGASSSTTIHPHQRRMTVLKHSVRDQRRVQALAPQQRTLAGLVQPLVLLQDPRLIPGRGRCCVVRSQGMAEPRPPPGIRWPRPARRTRPPAAGSPAPPPPARNGRGERSARTHAQRSRSWRCGPAASLALVAASP